MTITNPLVSVLIPVKNGSNYIEAAIKSVLSQDYLNFELIIGINPSTDGIYDVVRNFSQDH
jgi:glycosyltransferase involved in cell wall biosynthesis